MVTAAVASTVLEMYCPLMIPFSTHRHTVWDSVHKMGITVAGEPVSILTHTDIVKLYQKKEELDTDIQTMIMYIFSLYSKTTVFQPITQIEVCMHS